MDLKNAEAQTQMEHEDLEQEKTCLKQLQQELIEMQQENEEEKYLLDEESYSLMKLQSKLYENFNAINEEAYDLNKTETLCLKQDSILMLKERVVQRIMERKQRSFQLRNAPFEETKCKPEPDARTDKEVTPVSKSNSMLNRDEQDYLPDSSVNESGTTSNIPSSRVVTVLKKEQEVDKQVKAINGKKERLRQMRQMIEVGKVEIETMEAQLKREAEGGRALSFAKAEDSKKAAETSMLRLNELNTIEHEANKLPSVNEDKEPTAKNLHKTGRKESIKATEDPLTSMKEERADKNSPGSKTESIPDASNKIKSSERSLRMPEHESAVEKNDVAEDEDSDSSSGGSIIMKDGKPYDQRRKGEYGIRRLPDS
eukprot:TRINITY_DN3048_c0_g1_i1.p1 TRINITY_DN3048_c0_g1~~TRINITY_DN3048_c0_g1_i1.p1  ORF type:complete len:370 (-),score=112.29 TRINITY_DN3048_c0_g1_i1:364-1473(-)